MAEEVQGLKPSAYVRLRPANPASCRYSHQGPVGFTWTSAGRIRKPGLWRCCCVIPLWFLHHQEI